MTDTDREDLLIEYSADLIDVGNLLITKAKEKTTNVRRVIYVDNYGNDASQDVYDFKYYSWKSTDTMDQVAASEMGDSEFATLLSYFNGIGNESEIESGTIIKIPILVPTVSSNGNRLFAVPEEQENYGVDIKIDSSGDLDTFNGDFSLIGGSENMNQAILNRLTTASTKRIRYASYGIRDSIGDPVAIKSYLLGSIEQTLAEEPRIKSVENIILNGSGDKLEIDIHYTDINGNNNRLVGEL